MKYIIKTKEKESYIERFDFERMEVKKTKVKEDAMKFEIRPDSLFKRFHLEDLFEIVNY